MSRRTEGAYRHVFEYLHENIFPLTCQSVMTDFEVPMRNAFRAVVPEAKVNGCWFHHCQALRRQAKKRVDCSDAAVRKIVRELRFLALLPADAIQLGFQMLEEEARPLNDAKLSDFMEYYSEQWLQKVSELN